MTPPTGNSETFSNFQKRSLPDRLLVQEVANCHPFSVEDLKVCGNTRLRERNQLTLVEVDTSFSRGSTHSRGSRGHRVERRVFVSLLCHYVRRTYRSVSGRDLSVTGRWTQYSGSRVCFAGITYGGPEWLREMPEPVVSSSTTWNDETLVIVKLRMCRTGNWVILFLTDNTRLWEKG